MLDKIRTIYRIALLNGHDSLVLGAFGCGVFRLKPELVSEMFHRVLQEAEFRNKFHTVVVAIMEGKASSRKQVEEQGRFAAFYNQFGRFASNLIIYSYDDADIEKCVSLSQYTLLHR